MKYPMLGLLLLATLAVGAPARTIEIDAWDLTGAAVIAPDAPRLSWAGEGRVSSDQNPGSFWTIRIALYPGRSILMRFDLAKIPPGMRLTSAQLIVPVAWQTGTEVRLSVSRLLVAWGPGVCYDYRMMRPEKLTWDKPGATGFGTDRSLTPSAIAVVPSTQTEVQLNVTKDVSLWYTDPATNMGWILQGEDDRSWPIYPALIWSGREQWRLRVTYEPAD